MLRCRHVVCESQPLIALLTESIARILGLRPSDGYHRGSSGGRAPFRGDTPGKLGLNFHRSAGDGCQALEHIVDPPAKC
jgi:hypothetical protein